MFLWPFNHYPGSDYETFNYDWIIGKLKELKDSVAAALASEQAAAESAEHAAGSMGLALIYRNKAKDYRDEAQGFANDAETSAESISGVAAQVIANSARIDNLVANAGDTDNNAELLDIRVGFTGQTFADAGTAVREEDEVNASAFTFANVGTPMALFKGSYDRDGSYISQLDTRVRIQKTQVSAGDKITIMPGSAEKYARAMWPVGGTTPIIYEAYRFTPMEWTIDRDCEVSIVICSTVSDSEPITPETATTRIYLKRGTSDQNILAEVYGARSDYYKELTLSDIYEHKEVVAFGDMYASVTEYFKARARVKKEYLQKVPAGASRVMLTVSSVALVNGKYKIGFAFYDDGIAQIPTAIYGWYTGDQSIIINNIPENAAYFMIYIACVNDANTVDLDEIPFYYHSVVFDTSPLDYAKSIYWAPETVDIDNKITINSPDTFIKSVNHRGYNVYCPENTIPAFVESKKHGFKYVEADVLFTADNIPVILHDDTINRTARNADGTTIANVVSIGSITLEQALTYDFGVYKGPEWAGTKIPTFEEFISTCKKLSIHPLIELKDVANGTYWTDARINTVANIVKSAGMADNVSFISFAKSALEKISAIFPNNSIGYGYESGYTVEDFQAFITDAETLRTGTNKLFVTVNNAAMNVTLFNMLQQADLQPYVWTVNDKEDIYDLETGVTGVLSDVYDAAKILETYTMNTI